MKRGQVYDARLDPIEGSKQGGTRPVIIVSREAINISSPIAIVVPCRSYRPSRRIYPSQILIKTPDGGLEKDSIALGEQLRSVFKTRLILLRGTIANETLDRLDRALLITLDLPGQY